mmetsp:Transcript_130/g.372  ORF Transcript_130/g.372 Transcript_130/m.372 type:complete len:89 (+) Transcript_130:138-404(+)
MDTPTFEIATAETALGQNIDSICAEATFTHGWVVLSFLVISFMSLRLSINLVQIATQESRKDFTESHHESAAAKKKKNGKWRKGGEED